ncbi:MAG TPA: hypothetical protein VNN77_15715 [candidate division Zixibacteria bacterium]|nr:hypothetical protein [candidate division Zixibacteria bacterium]
MNGTADLKAMRVTIGDLIVAITEAALEATGDKDKAYEITSLALGTLLENSTADGLLAACDDSVVH